MKVPAIHSRGGFATVAVTCTLVALGGKALVADGESTVGNSKPIVTTVTHHSQNGRATASPATNSTETAGSIIEVVGGGLIYIFGLSSAAVSGAGALIGGKHAKRTLRFL